MSQVPVKVRMRSAIAEALNRLEVSNPNDPSQPFSGNSQVVFRIIEAIQDQMADSIVEEADGVPDCCSMAMMEAWQNLFCA